MFTKQKEDELIYKVLAFRLKFLYKRNQEFERLNKYNIATASAI